MLEFPPAPTGHFTVPSGVTLKGSFTVVPSHSHVPGWNLTDGTVLIPTEGRGDAGAPAFVTVSGGRGGGERARARV